MFIDFARSAVSMQLNIQQQLRYRKMTKKSKLTQMACHKIPQGMTPIQMHLARPRTNTAPWRSVFGKVAVTIFTKFLLFTYRFFFSK